jgi:hypothetical protein
LVQKIAESEFFELYGQVVEEALTFTTEACQELSVIQLNSNSMNSKLPANKLNQISEFLEASLQVFGLVFGSKYMHRVLAILQKMEDQVQRVFTGSESSRYISL